MNIETIVTLEDNERYYLVDETVVQGTKYFLANMLDDKDNLTDKSVIFEEKKEGDDIFVDVVKEQKLFNYITALFTASFIEKVNELEDE